MLHFGAVDWRADIYWLKAGKVAEHEGGYTPFEADISDAVKRDGDNVVVVRAFDPTDPSLPTGKQVGWYTPSSGIWQTVWLESRPKSHIAGFRILTKVQPALVQIKAEIAGLDQKKYQLALKPKDSSVQRRVQNVRAGTAVLGEAGGRQIATTIELESAVANAKLWTPETPNLYEVTLELKDEAEKPWTPVGHLGVRGPRSDPMKPVPITTACLAGLATAMIRSASSGLRSVKTFSRSAPGTVRVAGKSLGGNSRAS